jgi:Secretion system C-terminal sorting domain/Fibronectin type III domain
LSIVTNCGATVAAAPVTINFTTPYLSPANEPCSGAIPLSCGQTLAGTLNGTSPSNPLVLTCNGSNVGPTSVYYSLVGTGNPITVSLCSPNTQVADNSLIVLQGGCSNLTCIGANLTDPACPTRNAKVTFNSMAGQRYTIVVQNQRSGTFTGNFDLTATCAAPTCGAATGVAVSAVAPTSARVAFVAPVGGLAPTNYTVALTPASGPVVSATAMASPVVVPGLLPNTTYTACVTTNCGATASASSCAAAFTTPLASRNAALAEQLGLFPNPAQRSTTLTVPAALLRQNGLLSLIDALGRTVQQRFVTPAPGRAADTRAELDLRGLPAGVYTLRLLSSEGPLTKRLVVE